MMKKLLAVLFVVLMLPSMASGVTFKDGEYVKMGYATTTPPTWQVKNLPGTARLLFIGSPVATTNGRFGGSNAWIGSDVAQYLNSTFLTSNFSQDELTAGVLTLYGTSPIFDTSIPDMGATASIAPSSAGETAVFILDVAEIQALYSGAPDAAYDDPAKNASRTPYALGGPLWTRSPGKDASKVWKINTDGSFVEENSTATPISVRPVVSADISKILFKSGNGTDLSPYELTYYWTTEPAVTVEGETVTLRFTEAISGFKNTWPEADAFTVLDDDGGNYTVNSVAPGNDNSSLALNISPAGRSDVKMLIQYSQRFDDLNSGLNNGKGAVLKASNPRFAFPCMVLTAGEGDEESGDITITTPETHYLTMGRPVSLDLAAEGGTEPYSWTLVDGALPPGLTLATDGLISGTPSMLGTFEPKIQVEDSKDKTASKTFVFTVSIEADLVILTENLVNANIGVPYSEALQGYGGLPPYQWSASGLPDWLALDPSTGVLTGTPLYSATHSFSVELVDSADVTVKKDFRLTVNEHDGLTIETRVLESALYDKEYSIQLEASGGTSPYLFAVRSGYSLPHGLKLGSTGLLSGKPSRRGSYDFVIDVMDSSNLKGSAVYTMVIVDSGVTNPSGKDFKAKDFKDDKKIRLTFYLPKGYNDTQVLSLEALTSPEGYVESSSSTVTHESNGYYKIELMLHVSKYVLDRDDISWDNLLKELYFDGFVVNFQNCSGEITRFDSPFLIKDLRESGDDDSGGCNANPVPFWVLLTFAPFCNIFVRRFMTPLSNH